MNLYEKIASVMKDVSYLSKDDRVDTGNGRSYRAISEEKVTSTVRESLQKNGLVILPVRQEHRRTDETVTDQYGKQKVNRISSVDVTYRIQNIEDPGDYIEVMSSGTGVDTQDKGVGKAMTYAYKYMLLRVFAIPTGEDADKISSERYDQELYGTERPAENPICADCGQIIQGVRKKDGELWNASQIVEYSTLRFHRILCPDCQKKALKAERSQPES